MEWKNNCSCQSLFERNEGDDKGPKTEDSSRIQNPHSGVFWLFQIVFSDMNAVGCNY
jgi:hypothetical protein